jgi:hypothetical protein
MSYIIDTTNPFVSIKLTETGRQQLSLGQLTFSYWSIGDSEINYNREAIVDANPLVPSLSGSSKIFRPFDKQPKIKSFITKIDNNPFIDINAGNMNVIKAVVNNLAEERGFFSETSGVYTTFSADTYTPYNEIINDSVLDGTNILALASTSNISIGDVILIKVGSNDYGNVTPFENATPLPNLWFKVQDKTVSNVTLDRNLPDYSSDSVTSQVIVYRGGETYNSIATGNTTSYWDSGTLMFESNINVTCHDFPIWNMNNIWQENPAGITGLTNTNLYEDLTKFGSYSYLGTMNPYLEYLATSTATTETTSKFNCNGPGLSYPDDISKSISILHFTNNTISNLYGEFFYIDTANGKTLDIYMPDLMYHRRDYASGLGTEQGMRFKASGSTLTIGTSDIQYIQLIEDPTMISSVFTPKVVGKVFPQLKVVVIEDDELVAAMSYKSNRNWTLPELAASIVAPDGVTSTGVLGVGETMYLTYMLENDLGYGLQNSLSCQEYIKLTNNSSSAKDVAFRMAEIDMLPYMRKVESGGYDGLGFYATKFKLVYQIVSDASIRPSSGSWKVYDFTSTAITTGAGETIDPTLLENQSYLVTGFLLTTTANAAATTFDITQTLNMAPNSDPSILQFGDERFFYGNLNTYIGATIFKTLFDIRVTGDFISTTNTTRSKDLTTNPPAIKVSEVGIYDTNKNLVCIGKLSKPIPLSSNNIISLELSIDF